MQTMITVRDEPLKAVDGVTMPEEVVREQAEAGRAAVVEVDPSAPGTCIDEREREGVISGEAIIEPRNSAPGGPNIYGLYIGELTGYFGDDDSSGEERLGTVTDQINNADIESGGHEGCAANAGFNAVMGIIAGSNVEAGRASAQERLGDEFDPELYDEVVANAQAVVESGRYDDWDESVLLRVLGDKAGRLIERLKGVHKGRTFIDTYLPGKTVDQTKLHNAAGEDSFVNDNAYEDKIDAVLASGPDAVRKQKLAKHARAALLSALYEALPNEELHHITLK